MEEIMTAIGVGLVTVVVLIGICLIPTLIFWWAWNAVMPFLFGLPHINFWHALALSVILGMVRSTVSVIQGRK